MMEKEMNRRAFLKNMGLLGAAGATTLGMGRWARAAGDIEGGAEVTAVDADEKGGTLNLFVWNGYDADGVLNPFRERYSCKINVELLTDDPDAIMKLKAGGTRQFKSVKQTRVHNLVLATRCACDDLSHTGNLGKGDGHEGR